MELINADELCSMLGLPNEERREDGPLPSGLPRAYRKASEPSKFDLPENAVVRVGRQVRFRRDLIEEWICNGGTKRKARRAAAA